MKILHLAPIKGLKETHDKIDEVIQVPPEGISVSVPRLAEGQINSGHEVGIVSPYFSKSTLSSNVYWKSLANYNLLSFLFRGPYNEVIKDFGKPDILNVHDIYNLKQIIFSLHFLFSGTKLFITPRGTFSKTALSRSKYKKLVFLFFYKAYAFFIFSFIALNKNEKKQIQNIFPRNRIIIIGNGVEYDEKRNAKLESYFQDKSLRKDIKIGFLGRFDVYIKGLDILLNAYSEYQRSTNNINIRLSLLGEHRVREYDSREFIERIRRDLPYPELLEVAGPFYGNSKWTELAKLDLLIQPSRTEGMPNTVLEAMSAGVPCAVTPNTNVGDLIIKAQAGWVVRATSKDFLDFFHSLESCSKNELLQLGGNAKKYAKENLTWDKIGKLKYFN